jgi:two-component system nitrate/nitrite response regulator NarL
LTDDWDLVSDASGATETFVPNRILIIESQVLLANVVAIELRLRGFEVETIAGPTVASVVDTVRALSPVVVLLGLDLGPPLGSGLNLIGPVRGVGGRVLMMTGVHDGARLAACIEAGAMGIVDKASSFDDLVRAVRHAVAGEQLLTDDQRQDFVRQLRAKRVADGTRLAPFATLSSREQAVLGALMAGELAEAIARRSFVSLAAIRRRIRMILIKLDVNSQLAAVALARHEGWTPPVI